MQDVLVFLVEVHLKLVLSYFYEICHCKVDFCSVCVELHQISTEVEVILKQIIKLVRLSTAEGVGDMNFSSS